MCYLGSYVDKVLNNKLPPYLIRMVKPIDQRLADTATRGAGTYLLELPLFRTTKDQRAFSFLGPKTWNSLPWDVRMLAEQSKDIVRRVVIQ